MITSKLMKCDSCSLVFNDTQEIHYDIPFEGILFKMLCKNCFREIQNAEGINKLDEKSKEIMKTPVNKKTLMRMNKGKTEWNLLDWDFIEQMCKVMMYGMQKGYPRDNWKNPVKDKGDIDNSKIRHCISDMNGEFLDSESGLSHVAHEAVNCMIKYFQVKKYGVISKKD